jgi:hypothetical protein
MKKEFYTLFDALEKVFPDHVVKKDATVNYWLNVYHIDFMSRTKLDKLEKLTGEKIRWYIVPGMVLSVTFLESDSSDKK